MHVRIVLRLMYDSYELESVHLEDMCGGLKLWQLYEGLKVV
jgi:hypothetical protein